MKHPKPINIRAIREKTGMTQAEFAAKLGYSKRSIEQFEAMGRKRKTISPRAARYIATIFPSVAGVANRLKRSKRHS